VRKACGVIELLKELRYLDILAELGL